MDFADDYFKGEERLGFYIRPMMKRYWAAHLEMMDEFNRVCDVLGISYYADYGTLLGAVRHQGFIPWDDDIDICMLRGDYDIFRKYSPKEFKYGITLFNDMKTALAPLRIINTYAPQISADFLERYHGCPHSAGIDIYVIDRLPDSEEERDRLKELHQCIKYAAQRTDNIYMSKEEHNQRYTNDVYNEKDFERLLGIIEKATDSRLDRTGNLSNQLTGILDRVEASYWNTNGHNVVYMHGWARGARKPLLEEYYGKPKKLQFENIVISVPERYEDILIERFGEDYMTPRRKGASHEYPGYKKSQQILCDTFAQCGFKPPSNLIDDLINMEEQSEI